MKDSLRRQRSDLRAFTLTEMLFILIFMGVAGLIAARLFTASMRVIAAAPGAQDQHATLDRMSDVLRHDVWNARRVEIVNPGSVSLTRGDGATVRLALGNGEVVRSTEPGGATVHWKTSVPLIAEQQGPYVVFKSTATGGELRFVSQILSSARNSHDAK